MSSATDSTMQKNKPKKAAAPRKPKEAAPAMSLLMTPFLEELHNSAFKAFPNVEYHDEKVKSNDSKVPKTLPGITLPGDSSEAYKNLQKFLQNLVTKQTVILLNTFKGCYRKKTQKKGAPKIEDPPYIASLEESRFKMLDVGCFSDVIRSLQESHILDLFEKSWFEVGSRILSKSEVTEHSDTEENESVDDEDDEDMNTDPENMPSSSAADATTPKKSIRRSILSSYMKHLALALAPYDELSPPSVAVNLVKRMDDTWILFFQKLAAAVVNYISTTELKSNIGGTKAFRLSTNHVQGFFLKAEKNYRNISDYQIDEFLDIAKKRNAAKPKKVSKKKSQHVETPIEEVIAEETPNEEALDEEALDEETPNEEALDEETLDEETPTEETPIEETPTKEETSVPTNDEPLQSEVESEEAPKKKKSSKKDGDEKKSKKKAASDAHP
jgi:hypothetical protein